MVTFLVVPVAKRLFVGGRWKRLLSFRSMMGCWLARMVWHRGVLLIFGRWKASFFANANRSCTRWCLVIWVSKFAALFRCESPRRFGDECMYMHESISNPYEYPAPAHFPRALLGRCLWISGVLLLPSFLVAYAIDDRQRSTQCWVSYENIHVVCITLLPPILMIWKIVALVITLMELLGVR